MLISHMSAAHKACRHDADEPIGIHARMMDSVTDSVK